MLSWAGTVHATGPFEPSLGALSVLGFLGSSRTSLLFLRLREPHPLLYAQPLATTHYFTRIPFFFVQPAVFLYSCDYTHTA